MPRGGRGPGAGGWGGVGGGMEGEEGAVAGRPPTVGAGGGASKRLVCPAPGVSNGEGGGGAD